MREFEAGTERLRLDEFLARELTDVSVTRLRTMISSGEIVVNGQLTPKGRRLDEGDRISVLATAIGVSAATPEWLPLDILFEDDDLIAVNKQVGMLTHPSRSELSGTLTNALASHFLRTTGRPIRVGLVHRLDRNTSGVIIIAKNLRTQRLLSRAFRDRRIAKSYTALVNGVVETDAGEIRAPIGSDPDTWPHWQVLATGREAVTYFNVVRRYTSHSLLELTPMTGRTHQLRIHTAMIGHPIVGDLIYGKQSDDVAVRCNLNHHLLHAHYLSLLHPTNGNELVLQAPLPEPWQPILRELP